MPGIVIKAVNKSCDGLVYNRRIKHTEGIANGPSIIAHKSRAKCIAIGEERNFEQQLTMVNNISISIEAREK